MKRWAMRYGVPAAALAVWLGCVRFVLVLMSETCRWGAADWTMAEHPHPPFSTPAWFLHLGGLHWTGMEIAAGVFFGTILTGVVVGACWGLRLLLAEWHEHLDKAEAAQVKRTGEREAAAGAVSPVGR